MKIHIALLNDLPLDVFDNPAANDAWDKSPLAALSDAHLINTCVARITPPKVAKPSSFVLHAPLELLARAALLPHVALASREHARRRIAEVAVRYAYAGPEVDEPVVKIMSIDGALAILKNSLHGGDVDRADAALLSLLPRVPLLTLRAALVDTIAPMLGAAGHAPILLASLPRFANRKDNIKGLGGLLRAPLRTIAAASNARVSWHERIANIPAPKNPEQALIDCLITPTRVNSPNKFIAPRLLAVENNGDAARLLAGPTQGLSIQQAENILLRMAAVSMLWDNQNDVPYGWTHCLTLPQALLQNADASTNHQALIAVAATHVLAYRAGFGRAAIDMNSPLPASAAIFLNGKNKTDLITQLATRAALHRDAHVAKYTLACLDAAVRDSDFSSLYFAAAAHLYDWWQQHDAH